MKKLLAITLLAASAAAAEAQTDPEYRAELGGGVGMVSYQGDFNGSILKDLQPAGGWWPSTGSTRGWPWA